MNGFIDLKKPDVAMKIGHLPMWFVEAEKPFSCLYLLNTGILSTYIQCGNPFEELYYDNESEAYAAIQEYYEFNKQNFPYTVEMSKALVKDGYIEMPIYVERVSDVESEVMVFV